VATCDPGKQAAYRLADARTGLTLLWVPFYAYGSEQHALCAAGRQARRHAAGGTWVLVTGADKALLYVGERCFVPCEECRGWMLPRRRGNTCEACRERYAEAATARSGSATPSPRRSVRRRKRAVPAEQLSLPNFDALMQ
jgi:hypothetical protein